jgi:N-terminal domain of galactosyltransferase
MAERRAERIWLTVPCKGRLTFMRRSLPTFLAQNDVTCCVVDYDCPDGCGDWAEATFADALRDGKLVIERAKNRPFFNKSAAHNLGARRALENGASHVAFVDADTLLAGACLDWLRPRLEERRFWIAALRPDGRDELDLYGFLVAPASALRSANGYDERFAGWGSEDLDLRLRLRFSEKLEYGEVPLTLLSGLPHGDELRIQFYEQKDKRASNRRNQLLMLRKLRIEHGLLPESLATFGRRLWCHPPRSVAGADRLAEAAP